MPKSKANDYGYIKAVGVGDPFSVDHVKIQGELNVQKGDSKILREGMDGYYALKRKAADGVVIRMIDADKSFLDNNPIALEQMVACYRESFGRRWFKSQPSERTEGGEYLWCPECQKALSLEEVFPEAANKLLMELDESQVLAAHKCQYCDGDLIFCHDPQAVRDLIDGMLNEECNALVDQLFPDWPVEERHRFYKYSHAVLLTERSADSSNSRVIGFIMGAAFTDDRALKLLAHHVRVNTVQNFKNVSPYQMYVDSEKEQLNLLAAYLKMRRRVDTSQTQFSQTAKKQFALTELEEALRKMRTSDKVEDVTSMQQAIADMETAIKEASKVPKKAQPTAETTKEKARPDEFVLYLPEIIVRRDEQSTEHIKGLLQRFLTAFTARLGDPKVAARCGGVIHWTTEKSSTYNMLMGLDGEEFFQFGYADLVAVWNSLSAMLEALKKPTMQFWRDLRVRQHQRMTATMRG